MVKHESDFLSWHGFKSYPLPAQKAAIPIVMGGNAGKIFHRIANYGDGWFIPPSVPDATRAWLGELRKACEREGRNYDEIEVTSIWKPEGGEESLKVLADLGTARSVVMIGGPDGGLRRFETGSYGRRSLGF